MSAKDFRPEFDQLLAAKRISIDFLMAATEENDVETVKAILSNVQLPQNAKRITNYKVLQLALRKRYSEIAKLLISAGCDVNHPLGPYRKSSTPLFLAVKYSNEPVVQMLLERNAKVDIRDAATGMTPLQLAVTRKRPNVLKLLMNSKFDNYYDSNNIDVLQTMVEVYGDNRELEIAVQKLIDDGFPLTRKNNNEETMLHVAARLRLKTILPILLQEKLICVNERDIAGNTVLHTLLNTCAEEESDVTDILELVQVLLVNYNADLGAQNVFRQTPIDCAASSKHLKILEYLLHFTKKANIRDKKGDTALHNSLQIDDYLITTDAANEIESLKVVLSNGASAVFISIAIRNNKLETALLLSKYCTNLSSYIDIEGNNLLHTLATFSNGNETELLKLLVSKRVSLNEENDDGQTPISIALRMNKPKIALLLLKYSTPTDLKFRDSKGNSLLHYFAQYINFSDTELLKLLLLKGDCAFDECNKQRETPFSEAVERNKLVASYIMISDYETELEALQETWLDVNVSLFDFLLMNDEGLSTYARNGILQKIVYDDEFQVKYNVFGDMIQSCFQRGVTRRELLEEAKDSLSQLIQHPMIGICSGLILSYLDNDNLQRLIQTSNFIDSEG